MNMARQINTDNANKKLPFTDLFHVNIRILRHFIYSKLVNQTTVTSAGAIAHSSTHSQAHTSGQTSARGCLRSLFYGAASMTRRVYAQKW